MRKTRLGELLRERDLIDAAELDAAIEQQQQGKLQRLGEVLLNRGSIRKPDLAAALEQVTGATYFDLENLVADPDVLKLVPEAVARRRCALPIGRGGKRVVVVMAEPQDLSAIDELRFVTGSEIETRLAFHGDIMAAIDRLYGGATAPHLDLGIAVKDDDVEFFMSSSSKISQAGMREFQAEMTGELTPAVRLVSAILAAAAKKHASDIHLEQSATDLMVRMRVDGMLRELMHIPAEWRTAVISRVKILADMDIAERRMPQDGRCLARVNDRQIDLRISTLPTQYGEKIVMRLLDPAAANVPFAELGLAPAVARRFEILLQQPQGMVLVTGPTGSGKSTTLYTALNLVRSSHVNISTIEDPIEYVLDGINQVQVNSKAGRTFAGCLRSLLRQDPNIIMVGEIRDGETAEIALQAAQTGHLVLSTLHTNDSVAAITRLIDLTVPSYLIASSVTAVVAQRLVRKLCTCRRELPLTGEYSARLIDRRIGEIDTMFLPGGCERCDQTGYKGRVGIFELLELTDEVRALIRHGERDEQIRNVACSRGMKLMQEDAIEKLRAGITSLDEVQRVVPFEHEAQSRMCCRCEKMLSPNFAYCPFCGTLISEADVPVKRLNVASMRREA